MQAYTAPPGKAWDVGSSRLVFRGKPPFLSGDLELINHSSEKLKVRTIRTLPGKAGAASAPSLGDVRLAARLAPGERSRVRAHLMVDPSTPAGTYTARLDLGPRSEEITVQVFEKHAIVLAPNKVSLRGAPGDVLTHPLIISNRGNVTHTVPPVALVHLEERDWLGRSLVYALREMDPEEGHQGYLDRVIREIKSTDIPPVPVTIVGNADTIQPGGTIEVGLELTVPERSIKGRTYVRSITFMTSTLTFQLDCNGAAHSKKRRPL
ncbi:MAG: hypothetical protein ACREL3_10920 [Gemmatimonadales bacterium]